MNPGEDENGFGNAGEPRKILVIEDNDAQAGMMLDYLSDMAIFAVDSASSVSEALELFAPGKYFAIIMDLHLGDSVDQGMDLAVQFRRADHAIYIAAVSGYGPVLDHRLVGIVDVLLTKPINYSLLQNKLIMWLIDENRRAGIKNYADLRIEEHDQKILKYTEELQRICIEHNEIHAKLIELADMIGIGKMGKTDV